MKNDAIIQMIVCLLRAYRNEQLPPKDKSSLGYLLNQSIRQLTLDREHLHVSVEADKRWKRLTTGKGKDIFDFHYRDVVVCDKLKENEEIEYNCFSGSKKDGAPKKLHKNETFIFREMFHEDHITPVVRIMEELERGGTDEVQVRTILNKIHMCILLKEEDRKLGRTVGRTTDYKQVVKDVYGKEGITIKQD